MEATQAEFSVLSIRVPSGDPRRDGKLFTLTSSKALNTAGGTEVVAATMESERNQLGAFGEVAARVRALDYLRQKRLEELYQQVLVRPDALGDEPSCKQLWRRRRALAHTVLGS
jgi:hypothetical protein